MTKKEPVASLRERFNNRKGSCGGRGEEMTITTSDPFSCAETTLYRYKYSWSEINPNDLKKIKPFSTDVRSPAKKYFGFAVIDGRPIYIIRGKTAIAYIDGKRTEVPVEFVSAESYPEALEKFTKLHESEIRK